MVVGEWGRKQWSSTEVAVKLLSRQPVPGRVYAATRIQKPAVASLKLFYSARVTGARQRYGSAGEQNPNSTS